MNIHNLVAPIIAASAILSGCANAHQPEVTALPSSSTSSPASTAHGTPIDYTCEPLLDANWTGTPPDSIVKANALGWNVGTIQYGNLYVSYYRDCGIDVRGKPSKRFPLGPLLGSLFCVGNHMSNMFGYPSPKEKEISSDVIIEATAALDQLEQSTACADKRITPVS
jgi:hypothetical protein